MAEQEVPQLTQKEIEEYKEAFGLFDNNHDGKISSKELGTVMRKVGREVSEETIDRMIRDVDIDGNGTIDFVEFIAMMQRHKGVEDEEAEFRDAFKFFDEDGNGFIDKRELKKAMKSLGQELTDEDVNEMMNEADLDSDGLVNYEEFVLLMRTK